MNRNCLIDRRSVLQVGSACVFGYPLVLPTRQSVAGEHNRSPNSLILLWLAGGPSTIDMWDPKPAAPANIRGEFGVIPTSLTGVSICEHLPETARVLDQCTLIRSLHHNVPEHAPGANYVLSGNAPSPVLSHPTIGSIVACKTNDQSELPPYVTIDHDNAANAGFLPSTSNAFRLHDEARSLPSGITIARREDRSAFSRRLRLREQFELHGDRSLGGQLARDMSRFGDSAARLLTDDTIAKALRWQDEPQWVQDEYLTRSPFGRNVLRARRLITAGSRLVSVAMSGWDTHSGNFATLRTGLLPTLDQTFAALVDDLKRRGMLDTTIVCCLGEFGRTPLVNGQAGRDHWSKSFSALIAGGPFHRGLVHGETDASGSEPIRDPQGPGDLIATLLYALGIDPYGELIAPDGRPIKLLDEGTIIRGMLARG
ncbi:MAG: DUF1501 domain-containing protein [Planctomycetota bacterium]